MSEIDSQPERKDTLFGESLQMADRANRREQATRDLTEFQLLIAEKIEVWPESIQLTAGPRGYAMIRSKDNEGARAGQAFIVREDETGIIADIRFVGPNLRIAEV